MEAQKTSASELEKWFRSDAQFHHLYPRNIQLLARTHWTPLLVVQSAVNFLTPYEGVNVLDIGSGVGKFCLAAAYYRPTANFFGVEQRKNLVAHAEFARKVLGLQNAHFIFQNFAQLDMSQYDHFYFYNSFYENLADSDQIDDTVDHSCELYNYYKSQFFRKFEKMPRGTRLVTFHSLDDKIPPSYKLIDAKFESQLRFWMKI